ncbi:unnamed protein product, partial [Brassica rapa subsp. trilocularis]
MTVITCLCFWRILLIQKNSQYVKKPATGLKGYLLFESMIPLTELHAEDGGFSVN